jgi:5'-3' exonuclease
MLHSLREKNIQLVGVYDTQAPIEKYAKQQERKDRRSTNEERVRNLTEALHNYQQRGVVEQVLLDVMSKHSSNHQLLSNNITYVDERIILSEIEYISGQIIRITKHDVELSRQMLQSLSIPIFDAPTEAETYCAHLCYHNYVDAVLSNDTDVLVYRTKHFLTKLDVTRMMVIDIEFQTLTETLNLTAEQFIDFCIMCGTDYNSNIKRIGPEKAYKLIKKYGSIEGVRDNTKHDTTVLNFERVREIFSIPETLDVTIEFGELDTNRITTFQTVHNPPIKPFLKFSEVVSAFGDTEQEESKIEGFKSKSPENIKDVETIGSTILRPTEEDDTTSGDIWHKVGPR